MSSASGSLPKSDFASMSRIGRSLDALRSPQSVNGRIFRAFATVAAISIIVRLVAMTKELTVAGMFGRGDTVDALLIAMLAPMFVIGVIGGSLTPALVPAYVQVRSQHGREAAQRLFSNATIWSQALLLACTVLLALSGPWLLVALGSGFGPAKLALTLRFFYAVLPLICTNGLVITWSSILNAHERFWVPALTPALMPALGMLLLIGCGRHWGVWPLITGILIGSAMEAGLLGLMLRRQGLFLRPRWYGSDAALRQVQRQWMPLIGGALLASGVGFVDQSMAAMLPSGSVSALMYANRIVAVVLVVIASSLSTAVIPYFSRMVARGDFRGCRHTLSSYTRLLVAITVPLAVLLFVFSPQVVRALYERGAFGSNDTILVSHTQALYTIQLPFAVIALLYVRLLAAMRRNDLVLCAAAISLLLDVVLNLVLMRYWGVAGIALATSLFYIVTCGFVVAAGQLVLRSRLRFPPVPSAADLVPQVAAYD
jgi:putative peptidoglycan lipid II flippase